ncbi:hypothetical protein CU015_2077 [Enterococcus faecium]|nr:hypothetical protein [Enterococcus faecium]
MYKREKNNKIVYMNILPFFIKYEKIFQFYFFVSNYSISDILEL